MKPTLENWREELDRRTELIWLLALRFFKTDDRKYCELKGKQIEALHSLISSLLLSLLERVNSTLYKHYIGAFTEEEVAEDLQSLKKKLREECK